MKGNKMPQSKQEQFLQLQQELKEGEKLLLPEVAKALDEPEVVEFFEKLREVHGKCLPGSPVAQTIGAAMSMDGFLRQMLVEHNPSAPELPVAPVAPA
jgi:hypothetical protein